MATAVKKWFRARNYGYGWTPQTVEGWLVTGVYTLLVVFLSIIYGQRINDRLFNPLVSTGIYLFLLLSLTVTLVIIAYTHGDKPSWRWGKPKKK